MGYSQKTKISITGGGIFHKFKNHHKIPTIFNIFARLINNYDSHTSYHQRNYQHNLLRFAVLMWQHFVVEYNW